MLQEMLVEVENFNQFGGEDILWLKELLDAALPKIGETDCFLATYNPEN